MIREDRDKESYFFFFFGRVKKRDMGAEEDSGMHRMSAMKITKQNKTNQFNSLLLNNQEPNT